MRRAYCDALIEEAEKIPISLRWCGCPIILQPFMRDFRIGVSIVNYGSMDRFQCRIVGNRYNSFFHAFEFCYETGI